MVRVIKAVVGKKLSNISTGLLGFAKTITDRNSGNVKRRFMNPAICCPSCNSVTVLPIAVIIPAIRANDGMKKVAKTTNTSHGSVIP
jgi:hypothetical protein